MWLCERAGVDARAIRARMVRLPLPDELFISQPHQKQRGHLLKANHVGVRLMQYVEERPRTLVLDDW